MKKIVSSLIAGLMAVSLVMMGCSNDSSSDNSALMLLAGGGAGSGSGGASGTVAAGGAVKALADANDGDTVDLSEYRLSDKIALTVDKEITVKNAKLNGGFITVSEAATLDNVDGGTIVLVGDGKNATLKDCDAKNVIVKESELSRRAYGFTLKLNGGVVENIVNSDWYLTIETAKTTIKKLITNKSLVINSTDDSKIELIAAEKEITLAGKLVIEKAVSEKIVKVASNDVSIKKGMVEIKADDSELAEGGLDIEAIKAAVGELTESEGAAILSTVEALQSEVAEIGAKIEAAEEEANKALEEYEKEQAEKAVVTVYVVTEGQVSPANKVPLAKMEEFLKAMTAEMPEGAEIGYFSDEACTKPVDVKTIKAGDSIYIKVTANIPEGPVVNIKTTEADGETLTFDKLPLYVTETGYYKATVTISDFEAGNAGVAYLKLFDASSDTWKKLGEVKIDKNGNFEIPKFELEAMKNVVVQVWGKDIKFVITDVKFNAEAAPTTLLDGWVISTSLDNYANHALVYESTTDELGETYMVRFKVPADFEAETIEFGLHPASGWSPKFTGATVAVSNSSFESTALVNGADDNAKITGFEKGKTYEMYVYASKVGTDLSVKVLIPNL